MRALVIEDDATIATFIEKGLRVEGFAVDHAADGHQGLHLAITEPYDVAIVDVMLPGRDGVSVVEEIRRQR
ncbi:MAG: response regulator, partial [Vicinamibacterales bacterium]